MKKIMLAILGLILVALTIGFAFAQEDCVDCCGDECAGESASSSTLDIATCDVWLNGYELEPDNTNNEVFERGDELEVKVRFKSSQKADDVQVMAFMTGYHRGDRSRDEIFDITSTFDIEENDKVHKVLTLKLPDDFKVDEGDKLKIRIVISDKFSRTYIKEYNLRVEPLAYSVIIQDIVLDPAEKVQAGRGVFVNVRIKNMGEDTEDSLKVTASIPELSLKATEYVDELEADEATTSEDMFLRIPSCTEAGDYAVKATVEYADGDEIVTKQTTIQILEDPACQATQGTGKDEKTVVTVPGKQDVIKGTSGTVYPIILENKGVTDRSYQLYASGLDSWATYKFDPGTLVLLKAGETQTAYLYITPKAEAQAGEKVFMVSVETAGDKKQIALTANVVEGETQTPLNGLDFKSLGQGLTIVLIVLVVLVIIFGLIIGFNKLKGNEEPEEVSGQTYY